MADTKRKWDMLSDEEREVAIRQIIHFFEEERDEKIGVVAAKAVLDFFLETSGVMIYNKGVEDSILFLRDRFELVTLDMDSLVKK